MHSMFNFRTVLESVITCCQEQTVRACRGVQLAIAPLMLRNTRHAQLRSRRLKCQNSLTDSTSSQAGDSRMLAQLEKEVNLSVG